MKRVLAVAFALALAVCVFIFLIRPSKKDTVSEAAQVPPSEQAQAHPEPMKPNDLGNSITTTSAPGVSVTPTPLVQRMPPELEGATKDPAVIEFWSSHKLKEIGVVRPVNAQTKQLWVYGRMVFEASAIKNVRSMSQDGTIALAAVAEEHSATSSQDDVALSEKPTRIWIVDPHGNRRPISPPWIDASKPLIAPDASVVAFTGSRVSAGAIPQSNQLFVLDLKSGACRAFNANQPLEHYSVTAVEWVGGGKILKVIEDHGETGGHMVMRQIRLEW